MDKQEEKKKIILFTDEQFQSQRSDGERNKYHEHRLYLLSTMSNAFLSSNPLWIITRNHGLKFGSDVWEL